MSAVVELEPFPQLNLRCCTQDAMKITGDRRGRLLRSSQDPVAKGSSPLDENLPFISGVSDVEIVRSSRSVTDEIPAPILLIRASHLISELLNSRFQPGRYVVTEAARIDEVLTRV